MTSAFAQGFQMGGEAYDSAERIKLAKSAEERAKSAEERAKEQFGWQREEQEGKKGLRQAALEYANTGDTVPVMSGQGATGGIDEGGFTMKQEPITPQQKMDRFRQRALALGATPEAVQQYESGNYQLANARRQFDFNSQYDALRNDWNKKFTGLHDDVMTTFSKDGINGVEKKFGTQFQEATGQPIKVMGDSIIVGSGKDAQKFPVAQAPALIENALKSHYTEGFANELASRGLFADPKDAIAYMQEQRKIGILQQNANSQATTAAAATRNAETSAEFHGKGGVYERTQNAHTSMLNNMYSDRLNKPTFKTVTIEGGMDANGVKQPKRQVVVGITADKDGRPTFNAYTPDGKPINDEKVLNQAMGAMGNEGTSTGDSAGMDSSVTADLASARKRFENGQTDLPGYQKEVTDIMVRAKLPKPGGTLNPNAGNTGAKPSALPNAAPKTAMPAAMSSLAEDSIHRVPHAGFRVDGIPGYFPSRQKALEAWGNAHPTSPMSAAIDRYKD
jgi:hypothetical protein